MAEKKTHISAAIIANLIFSQKDKLNDFYNQGEFFLSKLCVEIGKSYLESRLPDIKGPVSTIDRRIFYYSVIGGILLYFSVEKVLTCIENSSLDETLKDFVSESLKEFNNRYYFQMVVHSSIPGELLIY